MEGLFSGKVALITGGSSGIGLAAARELAARGAHVWLAARNPRCLEQAAASVKSARVSPDQRVFTSQTDVSDEAQAARLVNEVTTAWGVPDLVINSAGIVEPGYVHKLDNRDFRRMVEVNYFGTVYVIQPLLPGMIERGSGHIVNISSAAGIVGVIGYSAYSASKFALRGYTDILRQELKPYGVRVSIVYPGDTDTPQLAYDRSKQPPETREIVGLASGMSAEDVAQAMLKGIARNRYVILPGFEMKFIYRAVSLLGNGVYPILDWLVARAQKHMRAGSGNQAG